MSAISQSRSGGLGWLLIGGALALVVVAVANAPMPALESGAQNVTTNAAVAQIVADADPLEAGEPMAAEPVGADSIGPRAGETYNIPGLGDVYAGQHAEERHGVEALQARLAMQSGGFQQFGCGDDGKVKLLKRLTEKLFAVVVLNGNAEVSAFLSERTYDALLKVMKRDGCVNMDDPIFPGGALAN